MTIYDDWSEQLLPWWTPDLRDFVAAVASMWEEGEAYYLDVPEEGVVGWGPLWDVNTAPSGGLPWLAQVVGERLPSGLTDAEQRQWISLSPSADRGSPQAIVNAVKRLLTGTQTVQFRERSHLDGSPDDDTISILTYAAETPNPAAVRQALRRTVPADIVWEYDVATQATWSGVQQGMADWNALQATYGPAWINVAGATPGFVVAP